MLALLIGISLSACAADDGVPDGMELASLPDEPFCLYVPESWAPNTASGMSGAYYSPLNKVIVSARYETLGEDSDSITAEGYLDSCAGVYAEMFDGFELKVREAATLGGENAYRIEYRKVENRVTYTCMQICTLWKGCAVSLNFYCPENMFDTVKEDFEAIRTAFVLRELPEPVNDCVTDKNTPDGMKIASAKNTEYRLYVPTEWICFSESGKSEAYFPESGKPNFTVTSYAPGRDDMTPMEYFAECEKEYKDNIPGYEFLESTECTVGQNQKKAMQYTYRAVVNGTDICVRQVVVSHNGTIYSLIYTALAERFDAHAEDVNAIISAFQFR